MSQANSVVPTLELISAVVPSRLVELRDDTLRIGRDPTSDVWLDLKQVSWKHAKVVRGSDGTYFVEDLESYNHTFLDGKRLPPRTPTPIRDGNRIRICDVTLTFRLQAIEVTPGNATILGTLDDVSSISLSSRSERAGVLLRAVLEINRLLGGMTEINEVLGRALVELFAIFNQAECGFIVTRESDGKLIPRATKVRDIGGPQPTLSRTVLDRVMVDGKAILISDATDDSSFKNAESLNATGIRTAMCVPITSRDGTTIGIIQLDSRVQPVKFAQEDLELLAAVSVPIGVVVENHRLLKDRAALAAAGEVQAALLPRRRPTLAGYSFWERYQPALAVGGDYYDYIPVENGQSVPGRRWAVAVGDVAGKGMPAALLMANLSAEVRHLVRSGARPDEVVARSNAHVYDADLPGAFVTFVIIEIDAETRRLTLSNAGHQPPMIRRANGTIEFFGVEEDSGLPLGIEIGLTYKALTATLAQGDVVVVFTDGVNEAMNRLDEPFGIPRVKNAVASAEGRPAPVGDAVLRALREHVGNRPQFDDIALVCFGCD